MPPRKTPIRRKKLSSAPTPNPIDDHKSPRQEVETGAGLAGVATVKTEQMSGQVEVSDPNSAKIVGDSTTSIAISPESMIKPEVVVENSAVGDVNEIRNDDNEPDVGGDKAVEDLRLGSEDAGKGEQGLGIDDSQLETVADDNEEEKQELPETISAQEPNADKAACNNDASEDYIGLLVEDDEESDDDSEGDDADNEDDEDPSENPVPDNKKDKDIEIYVGGLDKNTVEDDLVNVFQQFGELKSTRIVRNSTTNKSKGFAFVRFVSPDHAKHALSELKDGVEVRGKTVKISQSQDNHTLYLGNISKTWKQEEVMEQLKQYGIENIETIRVPENPKVEGKNKGFAFLEFNSHSDAVTAFQRLKKPDAVFGRDISAKVAFAQTATPQNDEDSSHAKRVYLEGLTKDWNEERVKEACKKYGEIVEVELCQNTRSKNKDFFGFITFESNENGLACVEGINNADLGSEVKIKAEIAKSQSKRKPQNQIFRGGFKVEPSTTLSKGGNTSKEISKPKPIKPKGGSNSNQVKRNNKDGSKNKVKVQKGISKNGESSKKAELPSTSQQSNKKRKTPSKQNLNPPPSLRRCDEGPKKKLKFGGEGQNSNSTSKAGGNKRKGREEDGGGNRNRNRNRNTHDKKPLKKQRGNMHGRERDSNYRNNPNGDNNGIRRGHLQLHDDYRTTSTRYMEPLSYAPPTYAPVSDSSYRLPPDSLSTRRFTEMEPHAGYLRPASTTHSRPYSSYVQPVVRTHNPHQTVYLSPGQSQSQSQRYSDRSVMTQSHRGYIETAVVPEVPSYRGYPQISRDPYDSSGISRSVRHDDRSGGVVTYVGGPSVPSSQVRNQTSSSYYQLGGGSYSGGYTSQRSYY